MIENILVLLAFLVFICYSKKNQLCTFEDIQDLNTCKEESCRIIQHENGLYGCPIGYHIEYKGASDILHSSPSLFTCDHSRNITLKEDTSIHFSPSHVFSCVRSGLPLLRIIGIIISAVIGVAAAATAIVVYIKCIRGKNGKENEEEGKEKQNESIEVPAKSARSKSYSIEPTSGMNKPSSQMESTNKNISEEDISDRKKSERSSKEKKEKKEKRGSVEQRSKGRGGSKERRGSKEKRGKSRESRGSKETRGKSKEKRGKTDEEGSADQGERGSEGRRKDKKEGKRPRVDKPNVRRGNTLKEQEQAKLNQRKGKLPVPNLAKCDSWDDVLFEEILKMWSNFSINERIGFCDQMLKKMNGLIAVQFMRLFQNALFVETDRRVWTKLHECFRLLYAQCEAEYYMNICERMYQTVSSSAADKLDKMGWQEKETDNVDDSYLRYICADLVLFDCQTDNVAKLYATYEERRFSFVSPLRIAVWTRVVREDDLSNEKMNVQDYLFEEAKLPRVKLPNEEYGTKLQHLIYAVSTSKDPVFTKELWKRLVNEKNILPADMVFVFKGTMIYPSARKRCLDLFMEEAFFRDKIPSDCAEYKEILRLFANSCVREAELQKIKDHVLADFAFTDADKKSFDFEMLEKRMANFLKEIPNLHATMNKYLIEDRDFLVVHKK